MTKQRKKRNGWKKKNVKQKKTRLIGLMREYLKKKMEEEQNS